MGGLNYLMGRQDKNLVVLRGFYIKVVLDIKKLVKIDYRGN